VSEWDRIAVGLWEALASVQAEDFELEVHRECRLAILGSPGSGKTSLARSLHGGHRAEDIRADERILELRLPLRPQDIRLLESATLFVLLLDATNDDFVTEVAAADFLAYLGRPVVVCYSKIDLLPTEAQLVRGQARWRGAGIVPINATDCVSVADELAPVLIEMIPDRTLSLARCLELCRRPVSQGIVDRVSTLSATYASASGLAEVSLMGRVPFCDEDLRTILAHQASMVFVLGLAYGLPLDWCRGQVAQWRLVDVGMLWQRVSRRVGGRIPLWGLESKTEMAYAATAAVGSAFVAWLDGGEALTSAHVSNVLDEVAKRAGVVSQEVVARARGALPSLPQDRGIVRRLRQRLLG
jgi:uncharacterized protein (DUF697 family)